MDCDRTINDSRDKGRIMNKQELASRVWAAADELRGNMNAGEYKDYVLGFLFYKYLSQHEVDYLRSMELQDDDLPDVTEDDKRLVGDVQEGVGYFIAYPHLFSTWTDECKRTEFDINHVYEGLNAFERLISPNYKRVFGGILETLGNGLPKLGTTAGQQTAAASSLLSIIDEIPVDGREDYDVLGFVYEYLCQQFASNAGRKSGEFYTPHEVSVMMSEIIAHHLKGRPSIKVYDPASGSGSLLLTVGQAFSRQSCDRDAVKYFAQEKEKATWNLTRMNLLMRGIKPANIMARNGDSLARDWPWFDDANPDETYEPVRADAATSNPPYSKKWNPPEPGADPRFAAGLAPKSKADYAFLLHTLYHVKPDGIMTIVLPHGVLFRGGAEGEVRKHLVDHRNIEAVIGLPPNIFYGTGIPTIVMVLRPTRSDDTVLFVDASKGFTKDGAKNRLRTSDVQRVVDAVVNREEHPKFSRVVGKDEMVANDYNLNIPRYVDSSEPGETWDIYSTMFGGIPNHEIDQLDEYWQALPGLRGRLFGRVDDECSEVAVGDIASHVRDDEAVQGYLDGCAGRTRGLGARLHGSLVDDPLAVDAVAGERGVVEEVYGCVADCPLIDKYDAYQIVDDAWTTISGDLENLQTNGMAYARGVKPHIVTRKRRGVDIDVQEGWEGALLPFDLVQHVLLPSEAAAIDKKNERMAEIEARLEEIVGDLDEDELQSDAINDGNDGFDEAGLRDVLVDAANDYATVEMRALKEYLELSRAPEKRAFIAAHSEVDWAAMEHNRGGAYNASVVKARLDELMRTIGFPDGSFEQRMAEADCLLGEKKQLKSEVKDMEKALHEKTKDTITSLTDDEVAMLLDAKWIEPIIAGIETLPRMAVSRLVTAAEHLAEKYVVRFSDVSQDIKASEDELSKLIGQLDGPVHDLTGLHEFQAMLDGER